MVNGMFISERAASATGLAKKPAEAAIASYTTLALASLAACTASRPPCGRARALRMHRPQAGDAVAVTRLFACALSESVAGQAPI